MGHRSGGSIRVWGLCLHSAREDTDTVLFVMSVFNVVSIVMFPGQWCFHHTWKNSQAARAPFSKLFKTMCKFANIDTKKWICFYFHRIQDYFEILDQFYRLPADLALVYFDILRINCIRN